MWLFGFLYMIGTPNLNALFFSFRPLPQILYTNISSLVVFRLSPCCECRYRVDSFGKYPKESTLYHILCGAHLDLQLHTKNGVVHFSNKARNVSLMFFKHKLATDITKTVWRVHTTTTWRVQSTTQYKIKFGLKNERALTASLEHEEIWSYSLLDFFSTAMFG
jgi:hypothetical protein